VTGSQTPEDSHARRGEAGAGPDPLARWLAWSTCPAPSRIRQDAALTWDPACEATGMEQGEDGLFTLTFDLTAGDYEYKVALNGDWTVNYGSDGEQDGPNYTLSLAADSKVTFTYDPETNLVEVTIE
jgi:hypothetical protein